MANINTQPSNANLVWQASMTYPGLGNAPKPAKFIPKNPDGTVYDCSALTSLLMAVGTQGAIKGLWQLLQNITPTIDVADATGVTCHFSVADPNTLAGVFGGPGAYAFTVYGDDGTNKVLVAQGQIILSAII